MLWNYHDDDTQDSGTNITVNITGLPIKKVTYNQYRIDKENSNSYEVWKKMGSPQNPTSAQIATLDSEGKLKATVFHQKLKTNGGKVSMNMHIPRQGVVLLKLDW